MQNENVVEILGNLVWEMPERGDHQVIPWPTPEETRWIITNASGCVLVRVTPDPANGDCAGVTIVGAGAIDIRPDFEVYRYAATFGPHLDGGALQVTELEHRKLLICTRFVVDRVLFTEETLRGFALAYAHIITQGPATRQLVSNLLLHHGGRLITPESADDMNQLHLASTRR